MHNYIFRQCLDAVSENRWNFSQSTYVFEENEEENQRKRTCQRFSYDCEMNTCVVCWQSAQKKNEAHSHGLSSKNTNKARRIYSSFIRNSYPSWNRFFFGIVVVCLGYALQQQHCVVFFFSFSSHIHSVEKHMQNCRIWWHKKSATIIINYTLLR